MSIFVANGWRFRLDSMQFMVYMLQNFIIVIILYGVTKEYTW